MKPPTCTHCGHPIQVAIVFRNQHSEHLEWIHTYGGKHPRIFKQVPLADAIKQCECGCTTPSFKKQPERVR
jgi:hypothetical protein